jgi:hypothetical protein
MMIGNQIEETMVEREEPEELSAVVKEAEEVIILMKKGKKESNEGAEVTSLEIQEEGMTKKAEEIIIMNEQSSLLTPITSRWYVVTFPVILISQKLLNNNLQHMSIYIYRFHC